MLPSLNQIGFDYMDWLMGPVVMTPADANGQRKAILWAIGAKQNEAGQLVADPGSDFVLTNQNFPMAITGIRILFNLFEIRGRLRTDGVTMFPRPARIPRRFPSQS